MFYSFKCNSKIGETSVKLHLSFPLTADTKRDFTTAKWHMANANIYFSTKNYL